MIPAIFARSLLTISQNEISADVERITFAFSRTCGAFAVFLQLVVDADLKTSKDVDFEFILTSVFIHHSNISDGFALTEYLPIYVFIFQ